MRLRYFFAALVVIAGVPSVGSLAAQVHEEVKDVVRAHVTAIRSTDARLIPGTDTEHTFQSLEATILEGAEQGTSVTVDNDFLELSVGDSFFAIRYEAIDGTVSYSVQDVDRRAPLVVLVALFVGLIVVFGGWYGVRALLSLTGSLVVLGYVLVPGLLGGWNPLVASLIVATLILFVALMVTHGFNRESLVAFGGTFAAIVVTTVIAAWAVGYASLSGFTSDESVSLNYATRGMLDLSALLVGGIIIGAIGVLDDIAITQVAIVRELFASNPKLTRRRVFLRALQVGREHVGAVVNTLALAYIGVSLPLVLFLAVTPARTAMVVNLEVFATELVRTVVGSFGIVLAVPLVTYAAVRFLQRPRADQALEETKPAVVHSHIS